jgi:Spy/CpxP family protein refolding chaperone
MKEKAVTLQRIRKSVLLGAAIAALAVGALLAGRLSAGALSGGRGHGDFAPRIFARMARALDLSDDQKTAIKGVLKTHAAEIEAQMRSFSTARRALHKAVLAQPSDESAIRDAAEQLGRVQGDGAVLFAKIRTQVEPLLTDAQRAKIQQFRERVRNHSESEIRSFEAFLGASS